MPTQTQLDNFTLVFHQVALDRIRAKPELLAAASDTLTHWNKQRGSNASEPYLKAWEQLIEQGVDAIEVVVCQCTDYAATMRNVSPLGFVLEPQERLALRRTAMNAA